MQVVLLERIEKLGQMGDVVNVKPGYARNFLLPQKKALRANESNLARFESERAQLEARNLEARKEAEAVGETLAGQSYILIRQASDAGALYGSVTARDIAEAATEGGISVDKTQVVLDRPVKELGIYETRVRLHPEVTVSVEINVARSEEEAALQAQGKSIRDLEDEAEAEAEIEIAELFDDMGAAAEAEAEIEEARDEISGAEDETAPEAAVEDAPAASDEDAAPKA